MNLANQQLQIKFERGVKLLADHLVIGEERQKPQLMHSLRVGMYLFQNDYPEDVVLGGLLHDLLEWTDCPEETVKDEFGEKVLTIVKANAKNLNIADVVERRKDYVDRCATVGDGALIVKAADALDSYHYYVAIDRQKEIDRSIAIAKLILETSLENHQGVEKDGMNIVVITGAWCAGKTHMANKLSEMLGWTVFYLDFYKEKRYDNGETGDLDDESYDDLFHDLAGSIKQNQSCIIESDFSEEEQVKRLVNIAKAVNAELIQVYLHADTKVLIERFIHRLESGERHSGHQDEQYLEKAKAELASGGGDFSSFSPLDLPGSLVEIDTTHFNDIGYGAIVNKIKLL